MPKISFVVLQSSLEFKGRGAGVGYSIVATGTTVTDRPASSKMLFASSAQDTSGNPEKW